jgi:hypothetical protein
MAMWGTMTRKLPHQKAMVNSLEWKRKPIAKECFWVHCLGDEIWSVEALEDHVLSQRRVTREEDIIEEATKWVADPVNPRTRDTRYFRMVEAYWMVKAWWLRLSVKPRESIMNYSM